MNILDKGCVDCKDDITVIQKNNKLRPRFAKDLALGKQAEDIVQKYMEDTYCGECESLTIEGNDDNRFDMVLHCEGLDSTRSVRIEVKDDRASITTGNICLEFNSYGKRSGIFSDSYEAEVLIYKSGNTLYLIDSTRLKNICIKQIKGVQQGIKYKELFFTRTVPCGEYKDGVKASKAFLIPIKNIKRIAFQIIKL